ENATLTFAWSFSSRPAGSGATLANPTTATPTFLTDLPGNYIVQLVVNDGTVDSAPDLVTIHVNGPPAANAGPDQVVPLGSIVHRDGGGWRDPKRPPFPSLGLLNPPPPGTPPPPPATNPVNPTFTADVAGTYIAQLVVNDGLVNSASDTVTITTQNQAPVANAGPDQSNISIGGQVQLDGSGSNDPDGSPITFAWSITLRPSGSTATLVNPTSATPTFVADRGGRYRIQLIVNDGQTASAADTVDVTTVNQQPIANAGSDQTVPAGTLVQLSGAGSS